MADGKYTKEGRCPVCHRRMGLSSGGNMPPHQDQRKRGTSGYFDDCKGIGQPPAGK